MRIVVTGAGGLVGTALVDHCRRQQDEVIAVDRGTLDIGDGPRVETFIKDAAPDVIINCAAWTDVDGCESDVARCDSANAIGPENLASAAKKANALLVTISTDYVFDGTKNDFYTQRDNPNPLSIYAKAKLEGERRSQLVHARTVIVRSGFIFGTGGRNFLSTVVERARRGEKLKVISDAWGTPTSAKHLAIRLRELAEVDLPGIYHVVNAGEGTTYEEFAREALRLAECDDSCLETVSFESLNRPAARPRDSRLRCLLSPAIGLNPLPDWREGMREYFSRMAQKHTEI